MRKGFTLIELIVVIAIIAILAAIIAPNAFKSIEKARISGIEGDYRTIKTGAMSYYADTGDWPTNGTCSNASNCLLTNNIGNVSGWDGPYLEKWPQRNPWGGSYYWREVSNGAFGTGALERYVVATSVPAAAITKIDTNLDDGVNSTGTIRIVNGNIAMHVSDDQY